MARCSRPGCDGSQHVVGLIAGHCENGNPHRFARLVYPVDLLDQVVRHPRTVGFVVGRDLVTECGPGQVEGGGDVRRVVIREQLSQHRDEDVHGVRRAAPPGSTAHARGTRDRRGTSENCRR